MFFGRLLIHLQLSAQHAKPTICSHRFLEYFISRSFSCWRCFKEGSSTSQCQTCHATFDQTKINYFELFGLPINYDVNTTDVVSSYHKLQKQFHPDKHSNETELIQGISKTFSMFINRAYQTLISPIDRGTYILSLHNVPLEITSSDDQELLTHILEIDCDITTATQHSATKIQKELSNTLNELNIELSEAFNEKDYVRAQKILVKMKYFHNLMNKVKIKLQNFQSS